MSKGIRRQRHCKDNCLQRLGRAPTQWLKDGEYSDYIVTFTFGNWCKDKKQEKFLISATCSTDAFNAAAEPIQKRLSDLLSTWVGRYWGKSFEKETPNCTDFTLGSSPGTLTAFAHATVTRRT